MKPFTFSKQINLLIIFICSTLFLWQCNVQKKLQWNQENGYRWTELEFSGSTNAGFEKISASKSGVEFVNSLDKEQIMSNRHLFDGSGVALGDVDGDGLCDIYLCRLNGPNVLYRNTGNFEFEDITDAAGVAYADQFSKGALLADIDGDTDLDLIVTVLDGPNACFINNGNARFIEKTEEYGLSSLTNRTGNTSMALGDIDGDGDLDLYLVCYKARAWKDTENVLFNSRGMILNRRDFGEPDVLYLNDGTGRFKNVKLNAGWFRREDGRNMPMPRAWGLTARMQDMDNDGDTDIYVCNDFFSPDFVWMNNGDGKLQMISKMAIRSNSLSAMTVDFSDVDRDGDLDFFIADMLSRDHQKRKMQMGVMQSVDRTRDMIESRPQIMRNTFFLNRGDGTYAEIANYAGLHASDWTWSAIFMDVDLDGFEDLLTTTGHAYDVQDSDTDNRVLQSKVRTIEELRQTIFQYPRLETPNFVFRNNGDLTFSEIGKEWGFDTNGISHGMAVGDLDNDGDLDVVMNNYQSPAGIYRNQSNAARIAVRLKGKSPNTHGIGAKVRLYGGPVYQDKELIAGGHYLSSSQPHVVFAAGDPEQNKRLEIIWHSGKKTVIDGVLENRLYEVDESSAVSFSIEKDEEQAVSFEDVSHLLGHIHQERPFDDFYFQPLLPNKLSHLGPGVAWFDVDRDGDDDLFIGSGRDGRAGFYFNEKQNGFKRCDDSLVTMNITEDQTAVLFYRDQSPTVKMIIGTSGYENTPESPAATFYQFTNDRFEIISKLPAQQSATGPLAMADYDRDGDLDLFVGGRVVPGAYPSPASSCLYVNESGKFVTDRSNSEVFRDLGMVSGAVFSDIDGDGDPDLLLALEWGPVKLFLNNNAVFSDETAKYGLSAYSGWWNGITTGDFNEDGKLDIVATNWGLNSKYHYDSEHALKVYYKDFDNNGVLDIVEAHYDPMMNKMVPERGYSCMSNAMSFIRNKVSSYEEFGSLDIEEILDSDLDEVDYVSARTLEHMVFLNKTDGFEVIPLPREAQLSPAFDVRVGDYDGDGHDDLFISQNFFTSQPETPRIDAGRGLWLKGEGDGTFIAVEGHLTGIQVYGEQRGTALSDFNNDGRVDLVVSQNSNQTKLYQNKTARPGLRVRLAGEKQNPLGIGAIVQLIYRDKTGPARVIHGGSGYWSQDSPTLVMGLAEQPVAIKVIWPDGKITQTDLESQLKEVIINRQGKIISS